jgi:hypothetical protein
MAMKDLERSMAEPEEETTVLPEEPPMMEPMGLMARPQKGMVE